MLLFDGNFENISIVFRWWTVFQYSNRLITPSNYTNKTTPLLFPGFLTFFTL